MIKAFFQLLLKSSCLLCCGLALILCFVAVMALFFDSHLPGGSIYHTAFGGNFGDVLLFAFASLGLAALLYSKLPPFNDIFSR